MENYPTNTVVDQLHSLYRSDFLRNLIQYIYKTAVEKSEKEIDDLIKLHNVTSIVYKGKLYCETKRFSNIFNLSSTTVNPKYMSLASEVINRYNDIKESIAYTDSAASKALSICKTITDVKFLFTEDIFKACDDSKSFYPSKYKQLNTPQPMNISDDVLAEFNELYPDFAAKLKQQILINLLIY